MRNYVRRTKGTTEIKYINQIIIIIFKIIEDNTNIFKKLVVIKRSYEKYEKDSWKLKIQ
jgi:hypothetical protein